ncbi:MAG: LysR family transcriptional regulator [Myxococcota bacterium]
MGRLELMRAFVRVVETGSLSRAALMLRTTQPTMSKWIRRLEEETGLKLLQRNTRGVRLTEAGAAYFDGARRIVRDVDAVEAAAKGAREGVSGRLAFSFPVGLGALYLSQLAVELQVKHPGLKLDIGLTDRVVDLVRDGVDLAIRIGGPGEPSVVAKPLGAFSFVLVAAPSWLARHGRPRSVHELSHHNYLAYGLSEVEELQTPRGPERVRVSTDLEVDNHLTLRAAALAGRGVCRALKWLVEREVEAGELEVVLPGCAPEPFPVLAVYLPARPQPEKLKVALAHFTEGVKRIPGWVPPAREA